MAATVFVVPGSTSYHASADCPALDTAQLYLHCGEITTISSDRGAAEQRPPCVVCAAPPATEWVLTPDTLPGLVELIEWSKPHWGGVATVDGLTIWGQSSASGERCWARFGDMIRRCPDGRYAVTPAAITES